MGTVSTAALGLYTLCPVFTEEGGPTEEGAPFGISGCGGGLSVTAIKARALKLKFSYLKRKTKIRSIQTAICR